MIKTILMVLLGISLGIGGDEAVRTYVLPELMPTENTDALKTGLLEKLPFGMEIGKTTFKEKPVFCIELPNNGSTIYKRCRVSPGFYASFTKDILSYIVWDTDEDARFHKEWREAGLNTNQTAKEYMALIKELGAMNYRYEIKSKEEYKLTFDAGHLSYRVWLMPMRNPKDGKTVLYFKKLETILSF